ncbi:MAG: phosphoenolpyruvate carboxykinase (ATP) [Ignavibacteria bacterium]
MNNLGINPSQYGLEALSINNADKVYWNLPPSVLVEHAIKNNESQLSNTGALVSKTGQHTGRSPKDKFFVIESSSKDKIYWNNINVGIDEDKFDNLYSKILKYIEGKNLYVQDLYGGADKEYQLPVRVITEYAWHSLFIRQLLIRPDVSSLSYHEPQFTIIDVCNFSADPKVDGTNSEVFIIIHLARKLVLIGGTGYAGEMKKSVFTYLNYYLPSRNVFPMHCSANIGLNGDTAVFFGLSGTGKTTLSADPKRKLIGDDEHGWGDKGIFNFEGGCYAKTINLSKEYEPEIWNAIRFGAVLENVELDENTRKVKFESAKYTENTRVGYPIDHISNAVIPGIGGHPSNILFLTCDAFGVLPPVAKLTPEQAMYHFLSGYTAKVAGTEKGVTEPSPVFSSCFGAPFLPLYPTVYADMLGEKISKHNSNVWLVNTGWTGGPYGVGSRMKISFTRSIVNAALDGSLANVRFTPHEIFKVLIPDSVPGVPAELLNPVNTWSDKNAYKEKAIYLSKLFNDNFKKFTASDKVKAENPVLEVA